MCDDDGLNDYKIELFFEISIETQIIEISSYYVCSGLC